MTKANRKLTVALLGGVLAAAGACAFGGGIIDTPNYGAITDRNVFDLHDPPPPPVNTGPEKPVIPPPNIKFTGFIVLHNRDNGTETKKALLTVQAAPPPGKPPEKEKHYTITEGQRKDAIEVVQIDTKEKTVTLNYNGETSTVNLADIPKSGAPAASGMPALPGAPGLGRPIGAGPNMQPGGAFPGRGAGAGGRTISSLGVSSGGGSSLGIYSGGAAPDVAINAGGVNINGGATAIPNRTSLNDPGPPLSPQQVEVLSSAGRAEAANMGAPYPPAIGAAAQNSTDSSAGPPSLQAFPTMPNNTLPAFLKSRGTGSLSGGAPEIVN